MIDQDKQRTDSPLPLRFFNKDGKPLRVLSTSLGVALVAHALAAAAPAGTIFAEAAETPASTDEPKLVEWSTEEVKAYYDAALDWNLPLLADEEESEEDSGENSGSSGSGGSVSTGGIHSTTVVHSGFGWDDLMLYHLIFNRGSAYSSTDWHSTHASYNARTGQAYKPASYGSGAFQNKPVSGSALSPKTSSTTGSITRRSTSSSPGGIGGKSSSLSSSSSSSSSAKSSSSGFGG